MKIPIGICGNCGGQVSMPEAWMGMGPPPKSCESCGATAAPTGPVIPMTPPKPKKMFTWLA